MYFLAGIEFVVCTEHVQNTAGTDTRPAPTVAPPLTSPSNSTTLAPTKQATRRTPQCRFTDARYCVIHKTRPSFRKSNFLLVFPTVQIDATWELVIELFQERFAYCL